MSSRLAEFCAFVRAMTPTQKEAVRRAWDGRDRFAWGHNASNAACAAADGKVSQEERIAGRRMASDAAGHEEPISWAAEGAANEIQADENKGYVSGKYAIVLTKFFFLPMFGFATPADVSRERVAA